MKGFFMCQIFSASIAESAGFNPNEEIPGLAGWIVDRQDQTAFYKITHNLGKIYPNAVIKVFVFSEYQAPLDPENPSAPLMVYNKMVEVFSQDSHSFLVRTLEKNNIRREFYEHSCAFGFVLVLDEM
jgi:hypothetical protein